MLSLITMIIILSSESSLNELFQTRHASHLFFIFMVTLAGGRAVMTCLMAALRLIYIIFPKWLNNFGPKRMGATFLPAALIILITINAILVTHPTPYSSLLYMADNRSVLKAKILWAYNGYDDSQLISNVVVLTMIMFHLVELILYVIIFVFLYLHDKSMSSLLSEDAYKRRKKKNVVTLFSQFLLFLVELVALSCYFLVRMFPGPVIGLLTLGSNISVSMMVVLVSRPIREVFLIEFNNLFKQVRMMVR